MKQTFIKKFISSRYGPIILGIIFTGITGWAVNHFIQNQIVSRQQKFEIYRRNIDSAEKILDETISLINSRMFYLRRVIWTYKNAETEDASRDWEAYRKRIANWNIKDMSYRTRLGIYFGNNVANDFMINEDLSKKGGSIYSYFYVSHRSVLKWKSCLRKACAFHRTGREVCKTNKCNKEKMRSQKTFGQLRKHVDGYIRRLFYEYKHKYLELR